MKKYLISAATALLALTATAQNQGTDIYENWFLKTYTTAPDVLEKNSKDKDATDKEIKDRLAKMDAGIDMPFNDVVKQCIFDYTKNGRRNVPALMGYSIYYMPIFEQALEENGLPLVLKYLPVIESRLDPNAVSKSGAAGLWQFKIGTAYDYGMDVNDLVDERRDPYKSTEGACRLLKDLNNKYDGDWTLAIAAYNCGPGTLDKARARAGGDPQSHDFWSIYNYLPEETRSYVPRFIAAAYVMTYYDDHNFDPVLPTQEFVTDSIHITNRVHFDQISAVLNIPVEVLQFLNPQFRDGIIPAFDNRPYNLILPSQQVLSYIISEDQILAYQEDKYKPLLEVTPGGDPRKAVKPEPDYQADRAPQPTYVATTQTTPVQSTSSTSSTSRRRRHDAQPSAPTTPTEPAATTTTRSSSRQSKGSTSTATTATTSRSSRRTATADPAPAASTSKKTKSSKTSTATTATATTGKNAKGAKGATAAATPAKGAKGAKGATAAATPAKGAKGAKGATATTTPAKGAKGAKGAAATPAKKPAAPAISSHAVKEGESLYVIAKKNGTTVEALRKANPKLKGDMIHPGDKLTVPKTPKAAAPAKSTSKTQSKTQAKPAAKVPAKAAAKTPAKTTKKKK